VVLNLVGQVQLWTWLGNNKMSRLHADVWCAIYPQPTLYSAVYSAMKDQFSSFKIELRAGSIETRTRS